MTRSSGLSRFHQAKAQRCIRGTPPPAARSARMREKVSSTASEAMDAVTDFRRKAASKLEESRQSAADTLQGTASSLHSGTDRATSTLHSSTEQIASKLHSHADHVSELGHSAADSLSSAADYVRNAKLKSLGNDLQWVIKQYPAQSCVVAAILGFLVARGLGSRD